ncbi:hypothetical protein BsWGS_21369 [Bradybaena similaris]
MNCDNCTAVEFRIMIYSFVTSRDALMQSLELRITHVGDDINFSVNRLPERLDTPSLHQTAALLRQIGDHYNSRQRNSMVSDLMDSYDKCCQLVLQLSRYFINFSVLL